MGNFAYVSSRCSNCGNYAQIVGDRERVEHGVLDDAQYVALSSATNWRDYLFLLDRAIEMRLMRIQELDENMAAIGVKK